jgi:hypothetical protein
MSKALTILGELIACASLFAIPFVLPLVLEVFS